ncbi:MAG: type IV toxin-antitoxin system AbiEi family antitoxin domain-containing protein [Promethearchaeota archaeon]
MNYNYIDNYLIEIQSSGRYSVTLDEIKNKFKISEKAILQNLYRLKSKNQLAQIRKEFYVIIPPQYTNRGMLPPSLFINDMMDFLNRDYYVSLLSAAALHGAGHQQPMEFQVMIKKPPLRKIQNQKLNLNFFIKKDWKKNFITRKKTDTGFINVSNPEMTAFDLVNYNKKIGGINRIIPILEDLIENINPHELVKTSENQKIPTIQRLGFLIDRMDYEILASSLYNIIKNRVLHKIPLSLAHNKMVGISNQKWKVIENTDIDI